VSRRNDTVQRRVLGEFSAVIAAARLEQRSQSILVKEGKNDEIRHSEGLDHSGRDVACRMFGFFGASHPGLGLRSVADRQWPFRKVE
jgi:hypothetical protein